MTRWIFGAAWGDSLVQHNQGGVFLSEGSEATLWTNATFLDNGPYGVYIEKGSHASLWQARVQGHEGVGVDVVMNSQVSLQVGTRVLGNGTPGQAKSAGIRLDGDSNGYIDGASEVTGNGGPGVVVDLGSSLDVRDAQVTGNAREGIRLRHQSVLHLAQDSVFSSNPGGPVTCDRTSLAISAALHRSHRCHNVERPSQPRPTRPPSP